MEKRFSNKDNEGTGKQDATKAWLRLTWSGDPMAYTLIGIGAILEGGESIASASSRAIEFALLDTKGKVDPAAVVRGSTWAIRNLQHRGLEPKELGRMIGFVKTYQKEAEAELKAITPKAQAKTKARAKANAQAQPVMTPVTQS